MTEDVQFSIISPVYGSPEALPELVARVEAAISLLGGSFEIILVDDRCPKGSWSWIQELAQENSRIKGVRLSRNFGQHPAIYAGLKQAKGEWIVVLDCDLQDVPEEIPALWARAQEGFDIVRARRTSRQDSVFRRLVSFWFYKFLSALTDVEHSPEIANFGIYRRKVISSLLEWREAHNYFPSAVQWVGFSKSDVDVSHSQRKFGRSSYNLSRLVRLALGIIVSFSDRPLRITAYFGFVVALLSLLAGVCLLVVALAGGFTVPGWASLMTALCFVGGMIILSIGLNGIYLGQVLREAKRRPNYIIDEMVGDRSGRD